MADQRPVRGVNLHLVHFEGKKYNLKRMSAISWLETSDTFNMITAVTDINRHILLSPRNY